MIIGKTMRYREIEDHQALVQLLEGEREIRSVAFQSLDFLRVEELASGAVFNDCLFLGCRIPETLHRQISEGSLVFPEINVPFNPYVNALYTHATLFRDTGPEIRQVTGRRPTKHL
jgi:hypothetical protein